MRLPKYVWESRTPGIPPSQTYLFEGFPAPSRSGSPILGQSSPQRIPTFDGKTEGRNQASTNVYRYGGQKSDRIWKAVRQKQIVRAISAVNAVISWVVTVIGYFVISMKHADSLGQTGTKEGLKAIILLLSTCQVFLIAVKWSFKGQYMSIVRSALKLGSRSSIDGSSLGLDPHFKQKSLSLCLVECGFHLVNFIPNVTLQGEFNHFGIDSDMSLDDLLYLLMLVRNYHTLELLFWYSKVSEVRTHLFAQLINVRVTRGFIFRFYMAGYSWRIVVTVMCAIVFIPGIIEYCFAHINPISDLYTVWSEYWVISLTQAPVGYGDNAPITLFAEVSLIVSCFTGLTLLGLTTSISKNNMDLNLTECNLYSELLYARYKAKYKVQAAKLAQRWWRLMMMRMRKVRNGETIMKYYNYLREYRSVLTKCQWMKDRRFERQIDAFDVSIRKMFRPMNEYLNPIKDAQGLVQDIVRNQYRIDVALDKVCKLVKRNSKKDVFTNVRCILQVNECIENLSLHRNNTTRKHPKRINFNSGQNRAKAKNQALHFVRSRLIRGGETSNFQLTLNTSRDV